MAEGLLWRIARWPARLWRCLAGDGWRAAACRIMAVLVAMGLAGLLFLLAGLVPIAASAGHWPIVRWGLHAVMQHTVHIRTLGREVPDLDDPGMAVKGAGHYDAGCAPCHGAPGRPRPLVVKQMLPVPPPLSEGLDTLEPAEVFWVVKHGLKYTGMPGWASQQRDDEVWAMVAFLRRLPDLDPAAYRALAYGPVESDPDAVPRLDLGEQPAKLVQDCARCHGARGEGRGEGAIPRLAGQREAYLFDSLRAFARGDRHSGVMQPVAAPLDAVQMRALARYYARLPVPPAAATDQPSPATLERARILARGGRPGAPVPACLTCHAGPDQPNLPGYPSLDGLHPRYIAQQLRLFRDGRRGGGPYAGVMRVAADRLDDADIDALARFYGARDPRLAGGGPDPTVAHGRMPPPVP